MKAYLVGIKGTGMAHLAVLLKAMGHVVGGCDSAESFATEAVLEANSIAVDHGFGEHLLPADTDLVIHSSAYRPSVPIIALAIREAIEVLDYPSFVATLTQQQESWAVVGTHGKTTTCAVATHLLSKSSRGAFPFYALYGSRALSDDRIPYWGRQVALFEGCEYQDHFLSYTLRGLLITVIDWDHPDYFVDSEAVYQSFERRALSLTGGGILIYNADDRQQRRLVRAVTEQRTDLTIIAYGFTADGLFKIVKRGRHRYAFSGFAHLVFDLVVDERALVADHLGALLLAVAMLLDQDRPCLYLDDETLITDEVLPTALAHLGRQLALYAGVGGRLEVIAQEGGILVLDDYAHHPQEIEVLLAEVADRYPGRPLVVLFCPHTASRTLALIDRFVASLCPIDYLVIQPTYASARFDATHDDSSTILYERLAPLMGSRVVFAHTDDEAVRYASAWLQEGTVCITMGAGNNRALGHRIAEQMRSSV